ncbi:hypothetical protein OQA88_6666 [Cercophora sp. LCS_1]
MNQNGFVHLSVGSATSKSSAEPTTNPGTAAASIDAARTTAATATTATPTYLPASVDPAQSSHSPPAQDENTSSSPASTSYYRLTSDDTAPADPPVWQKYRPLRNDWYGFSSPTALVQEVRDVFVFALAQPELAAAARDRVGPRDIMEKCIAESNALLEGPSVDGEEWEETGKLCDKGVKILEVIFGCELVDMKEMAWRWQVRRNHPELGRRSTWRGTKGGRVVKKKAVNRVEGRWRGCRGLLEKL